MDMTEFFDQAGLLLMIFALENDERWHEDDAR
jgi:hypothetical protein